MASETQAHDAHEHGHFGPEMWVIPEPTGLVADVTEKQRAPSALFRAVLIIGAALTVLGIIGFVLRLMADGFSDHRVWGYYVAAFAFVFTLTSSAPWLPALSGSPRATGVDRCPASPSYSRW